jgi:hypothetical protein
MKCVLCLLRTARCAVWMFTEQNTKLRSVYQLCQFPVLQSTHTPSTPSEYYRPPSYIGTYILGLTFVAVWHGDTLEWDTGTVLDLREQLWHWIGSFLSIYPTLCYSHPLSGVQFITSLNWNLCRDIAEQKRAENKRINSHTQDTIALRLNALLYGKLWSLLTNMYRFVYPWTAAVKVTILLYFQMQLALSLPFQL